MYHKEELCDVLKKNGYERVDVTVDWHALVREKYKSTLDEATMPVLDRRCPLAISHIEEQIQNKPVLIPPIEPILIHCAIELSKRESLKGKKKIITTPCESLVAHGNQLKLEDTFFVSWKEFVKTLNGKLDLSYCEGKPGQVAPNGGRYYFEIGYNEKIIQLYLKEGIIPEEFMEYSKLAKQCKDLKVPMNEEDQEKLLSLRQALANSIMESKPEDLFVIL